MSGAAPGLEDPAWGPVVDLAVGEGWPLRNGAVDAYATADGVYLSASRIDAVTRCELGVLATSQPSRTLAGLAQVRRLASCGPLHLTHVIFAPPEPRPLLLSLARLINEGDEPLVLDHTEAWEVDGDPLAPAPGACGRLTAEGPRVLADAGIAVRARVPDAAPRGLALDVRLPLPPHSARELHFALAAPGPGDGSCELLVRAWRGEVARALVHTARHWIAALGAVDASAVAAYRVAAEALANR